MGETRDMNELRQWGRSRAQLRAGVGATANNPDNSGLMFRCTGHDEINGGGYGLSWNPKLPASLLSGGDDGKVCHWDLREALTIQGSGASAGQPAGGGAQGREKMGNVTPNHTFSSEPGPKSHFGSTVNSVVWHPRSCDLFVSVGDDGRIIWWDLRQRAAGDMAVAMAKADAGTTPVGVNCVAVSPHDGGGHVFVTGQEDATVRIWDRRAMRQELAAPLTTYDCQNTHREHGRHHGARHRSHNTQAGAEARRASCSLTRETPAVSIRSMVIDGTSR